MHLQVANVTLYKLAHSYNSSQRPGRTQMQMQLTATTVTARILLRPLALLFPLTSASARTERATAPSPPPRV